MIMQDGLRHTQVWSYCHGKLWPTKGNPEIYSKSQLRPHIFTIYILIVLLRSFYSREKVSNTNYSIFDKHWCLSNLQDFCLLISLKLNRKWGNFPNTSTFPNTIIVDATFTKTVLARWLLLARWLRFKANATLRIQVAHRKSGLSAMIRAG